MERSWFWRAFDFLGNWNSVKAHEQNEMIEKEIQRPKTPGEETKFVENEINNN